jgi:prophage regulatory protein
MFVQHPSDEGKKAAAPVVPRLIRRTEVEKKTGLTRATLYDLVKQGKFPAQLNLTGTRCVAWDESAVDRWILDQLRANASDDARG